MTRTRAYLDAELEEIERHERSALRREWARLFGRPAPRHLSRDLLARAAAYAKQVETCGGLRPATVRRLKRLAEDYRNGEATETTSPNALRPGVRLMREWRGETHVVEVLAEGFAWRGARYTSLSAVARAITGARWSGLRFFGLNNENRAKVANAPTDSRGNES